MARKILILVLSIWLISCEMPLCGCDVVYSDELTGKWKLVRIVNAFARMDKAENEIGYSELIQFDFNRNYIRQIDGKVNEEGSYELGGDDKFKNFIKYTKTHTYQPYRFQISDGKQYLILYEKMPVGAVLADGSDYYFLKQ
ncbi:MAG: hypothetical protein MUF45_10130 [Spirosomaceae bacterium]|jgi:hypothetical protein|nr:hypothetical protein [Spirosomataceae bacterium]